VCGVGQVRLFVRVSYEECRVAVGVLERLSVWCWAGPSVCVCICVSVCVCVYVIRGMPSSYSSAVESECVCWAGPSVCECVIRGMLCSCQSPGESECVVLGRSVCVCVCHTRNTE